MLREELDAAYAACLKRVYSALLHLQFPSWSLEADELHRDMVSCFGPEIYERRTVKIRLSRRDTGTEFTAQSSFLFGNETNVIYLI